MKVQKKPVDFYLLFDVIILLVFGLLMVLSSSSYSALIKYNDSNIFFKKQFISALIGIVAMIILSNVDYKRFKKFSWLILFGAIIIQTFVLIPGLGIEMNGAKRWINLGFTTLQPSEFMKIAVIIFLSAQISSAPDRIKYFFDKRGVLFYGITLILAVSCIIGFQKHMSASILIILIGASILIAGGLPGKFIASGAVAGILGSVVMIAMASFRVARFLNFLDPWKDLKGKGWQAVQSLYAIGSGGFFGVGLGQSRQKYLYIPEPHNDFIFSILSEELGFIGITAVLVLFIIFIWRGIVIATKSRDLFGALMAIGITSMVGLQVIINLAVVSASMPVTGMPLPFFSYGGTSLIILLSSVGVLLNISRNSKI